MNTHNFTLVNVDTDAISFCKEDMSNIPHQDFMIYLDEINSFLPDLIEMEEDGEYQSFVVVKAKNYIMRYFDKKKQKIVEKFKGGALIDSKKELALKELLNHIGIELLDNGIIYENLIKIYNNYIIEVMSEKLDIKRWSKKMTLTKSILNCATDDNARTNEKKPYDAIKDKNLQEGDKFWVYPVKGNDVQEVKKGIPTFRKDGSPKMVENIILKCYEDYNNDHHIPKLLARVYDTICIFDSILDINQFIDYSKNPKLLDELFE